MITIWKFPLSVDDWQVIVGQITKILTVQLQDGVPMLWAIVDTKGNYKTIGIRTFGTGHEMDTNNKYKYIGTYLIRNDKFVGHVFEVVKK